jgi:hypothetical protein
VIEALKRLHWRFLPIFLAAIASVGIALQPVSAVESPVSTKVQGPNDNATVPKGFPLDIAWDGVNTRRLLTNTTGALSVIQPGATAFQVEGRAADGAAAVGNPVQMGGVDGSGNSQAWLMSTTGAGVVRGEVAAGAAASGTNPFLIAGSDGTNVQNIVVAAQGSSDGVSTTTRTVQTAAFAQGFNGSTWDRLRTANGASNTTGTGLLGAGIMGFDGTNWQSAPVRTPADASSAVVGLGVNSQDQVFNGTNWDRVRSLTAAAGVTGVLQTAEKTSFGNINSNATTTLKSGAGVLHTITINKIGATANTATVYDNTAGSGTVIAVIDTTIAAAPTRIFDAAFGTGLTIVTATGTAADITVTYH